MNTKKYVIFTDLKDFTYKNALLTDGQIEEILWAFEEIVETSAKRYNIQLVKSIGDAYLAMSDTPDSAYDFAKNLIVLWEEYDTKQKIQIKEIGLRVTITFGTVSEKDTLNHEDYFGECINLGSRIMDITPKGAIFCTSEVHEKLKHEKLKKEWEQVGKFEFQWIIYSTEVWSLTPLEIWVKEHLNSKEYDEVDKLLKDCDELVFRSSCVAALLSLQPIPIIDSYNIVWVHLYMILKLATKFEKKIQLRSASQIFLEIVSPLSLSYISLQWISTAAKIILPWIGGYLIAPASFGVSYALWKIYTAYFYYHIRWEKMPKDDIKLLFSKQKKLWQEMAWERKKEIFATGKNFYKEVLSIKWESGFKNIKNDTVKMLKKK